METILRCRRFTNKEKRMKRLVVFVLALALIIPGIALADTITWEGPTTYVSGNTISDADQAKIVYHIFADKVEFASVTGVRSWDGKIPQNPGETKTYDVTAELNGATSDHSKGTVFVYPAEAPNAPENIIIHIQR